MNHLDQLGSESWNALIRDSTIRDRMTKFRAGARPAGD